MGRRVIAIFSITLLILMLMSTVAIADTKFENEQTTRSLALTGFYNNMDLVAKTKLNKTYSLPQYIVTFVENNGSEVPDQNVECGGKAVEPVAPIREGHTFAGWYEDESLFTPFDFNSPITGPITIYAKWEISTYEVRFFASDGVTQLGATQTVEWGTAATLEIAPVVDGHTFDNWVLVGSNDAVSLNLSDVRDNIDAIAVYTIKTYNVTFVDYDGTVLKVQTVDWNTSATAPADPMRDGNFFTGWDKDFTAVTADMTVTAQYNIKRFTVRFFTYSSEIQIGVTQTVKWDSSAVLEEAPERTGHTFDTWILRGDDDTVATSLTNVRENIDAVAGYTRNRYTVTFVDHNDNVIGTDLVLYGDAAAAPTVSDREGYSFVGWDNSLSYVTANMRIKALYRINTYKVIFMNYDGAILNTQTVNWSAAAIPPTVPDRVGYSFTGWDTDFDVVIADITITAQFKRIETVADEPIPGMVVGNTEIVLEDSQPPRSVVFPWWWVALGTGVMILLLLLIFFNKKWRKN